VSAFCVVWSAQGGNCPEAAIPVSPKDTPFPGQMLRYWNPSYKQYVVDESTGIGQWVTTGGWVDGAAETETDKHIGCLWLQMGLAKGYDYVIGFPTASGTYVVQQDLQAVTYTKLNMVTEGGYTYYYVRAEEWAAFDPDAIGFKFGYIGPAGSVGREFNFIFRQASIDEYLKDVPGTVDCPLELDVSRSGSATIAEAKEIPTGFASYVTAYTASLKSGENYVFSGTHALYGVQIVPYVWDSIPGEKSLDKATGVLTVTPSANCKPILLVMPDNKNWQQSVAGGTLQWLVGKEDPPTPEAQPVWAGTFSGVLTDADGLSVTAEVSVVAKVMDDTTTNFTATIKAGGLTVEYADDGDGCIAGVSVVKGTEYDSYFDIEMNGNVLSLSGTVTLPRGNGAYEYTFDGALYGSGTKWAESFLAHDPKTESAAKMGITDGAFKDQEAGSPTLVKLHKWGSSCNVSLSEVNDAAFDSETGDPETQVAKAYLLDCPNDPIAIAAAAAEFVVTSFDPATGVVIRGGKGDGGDYGNGYIDVRTSATPNGDYSSSPSDGSAKFYRAYLVVNKKEL